MPKCEPYVLTQCDINFGNIMIKDGELVGILDWEFSGYHPAWYECISTSYVWSEDDAEWKKLLRERLDKHDEARDFWMDLYNLRQYPD